mgnify:CR=1 FL=1
MKRFAILLTVIVLGAGCGTSPKPPEPRDFAFGLPIEISNEGAIFEAPLPLDFYRGLAGNDVTDLCVFNGQGEVVPYAVRKASQDAASAPAPIPLPLFPIPSEPGRQTDDIRVMVQRDASGAVVRMESTGRTSAQTGGEAGAAVYLIDAASLRKPVKALEFDWTAPAEGFVGSFAVEGSNDLEHWSAVVRGSTLASLQYGEYTLVQRRIEFRPVAWKYLRIRRPEALKRVQIVRVSAEPAEDAAEPPRQWVSVGATPKGGEPGEYLFETPGPLPVDRIRIRLPQKNTLAAAELYSRIDAINPWTRRGAGLVYQLHLEEGDLAGPDFALSPSPGRFWMLRVRQSGGGLGQGAPEIELGWVPQHLLFVARGEGPFLLAYGNARHHLENTRVDDLLAGLSHERRGAVSARPAGFGARILLGGETRREASLVTDPRKVVLWAVLILAVAALAWMSIRLFRQIGSRNTDRPPE